MSSCLVVALSLEHGVRIDFVNLVHDSVCLYQVASSSVLESCQVESGDPILIWKVFQAWYEFGYSGLYLF